MFQYPNTLLQEVREKWQKRKYPGEHVPPLPSDDILSRMLEVAYHASFLTEEGRRLGFRVAYLPQDDATKREEEAFPGRMRPIALSKPRDFSVGELLRLAPATDPTKVLICVEPLRGVRDLQSLAIWGLLDAGSSWWNFVHGESSEGIPPPNCFTISSTRPGHLSVSRVGLILATLSNGRIVAPTEDIFYEGPIGAFFEPPGKALYNDVVTLLGTKRFDPEGQDDNYPQRRYVEYLERVLFHVRDSRHGGMLIVVRDELTEADSRLTDRVSIKYPSSYDIEWDLLARALVGHTRYYELWNQLWDGKEPLTADKFQEFHMVESGNEDLEVAIADSVKFIASLSGVDGAIAITDRLRVIGFGVEITALSPTVTRIKAVSDSAGKSGEWISIDTYGTRHRSAIRFCSSYEESVAFVVSQDGGVKAVKRVGSEVLLWPDINVGFFGI